MFAAVWSLKDKLVVAGLHADVRLLVPVDRANNDINILTASIFSVISSESEREFNQVQMLIEQRIVQVYKNYII